MRGRGQNIMYARRKNKEQGEAILLSLYKETLEKIKEATNEKTELYAAVEFLENKDRSSSSQEVRKKRSKLVDEIVFQALELGATKKARQTRNQILMNMLYLNNEKIIQLDEYQENAALTMVNLPRIQEVQTYMIRKLTEEIQKKDLPVTEDLNLIKAENISHIVKKGYNQKDILCSNTVFDYEEFQFLQGQPSCTRCRKKWNKLSPQYQKELHATCQATKLSKQPNWKEEIYKDIEEKTKKKLTVRELSEYIWSKKDDYCQAALGEEL